MKNSFTVFEIILSITISSIIIIYATGFSNELFKTNEKAQEIELNKINFLSTKIFLQKHKHELEKLEYKNESLYFDKALLIDKIKEFKIKIVDDKTIIDINLDNKLKQKWEF